MGTEPGSGAEVEEELEGLRDTLRYWPSESAMANGFFTIREYGIVDRKGRALSVPVPLVTEKGRRFIMDTFAPDGRGGLKLKRK